MKAGRHMGGKAVHRFKRGGAETGVDEKPAPRDVYAGEGSPTMKAADEKHSGGKVKRKMGGSVEHGEHERAHHKRMDRPGRKRGGGVGADMHPLSTASRTKDAEGHKTGPAGEDDLDEDD